ncbi:PREDICTED: uncharacterized protein LOC104804783 [Tarenaya hassleriana]|uniref:uncharacterized protein LOC104804783 n=1 Tax=Tarenaya hassleriana TaxID=28532 RepID=UPI0008FD590D|nr:PREDICTED: uncharacterized protein LOC104804783 [Tarenaya hassleriana]
MALISTTSFGELDEVEIQRYLKRVNKPAVKSIKSPDGDIIDCVDMYKQPAFDHPLMKNHTIRSDPTFLSKNRSMNTDGKLQPLTQLWHRNGKCPENTVPIRRTTREDLLRWGSIKTYGKKDPSYGIYNRRNRLNNGPFAHEYAVIQSKNVGKYVGADANMNLWKPHVAHAEEFSLAQMWLVANGQSPTDMNTIEVGWQAYPRLYGDDNPRLFIFWTSKSYQNGCYNLQCEGFVQKSGITLVGAALEQVSTYNVQMAYLFVTVRKEPFFGDWWLIINGVSVGYWPRSLFTSMQDHADRVDFGGEIVNAKSGEQHTETTMGSGHFAAGGFGQACSMDQINVYNEQGQKVMPHITDVRMTNALCYDLFLGTNNLGPYIYFGGPGRNPTCP